MAESSSKSSDISEILSNGCTIRSRIVQTVDSRQGAQRQHNTCMQTHKRNSRRTRRRDESVLQSKIQERLPVRARVCEVHVL